MIPKKTELCWAIRSAEKCQAAQEHRQLGEIPEEHVEGETIHRTADRECRSNEPRVNGKSNGPDNVRAVVTET